MDTGYFLRKFRHDKHFFIGTFSNLSTCGPKGAIQLELKASFKNPNSSPDICGGDKYIFLFNFNKSHQMNIKLEKLIPC
jgi:hypothetical protein